MRRRRSVGFPAAVLSIALATACASKGAGKTESHAGKGFRALEAVVVGREFLPPGSPGTSMSGSGAWFLEFEAKDGEATAHYRYPVTREQYNRYPEGTRVQLILADERLREIRPLF